MLAKIAAKIDRKSSIHYINYNIGFQLFRVEHIKTI